MKTKLSLYLAFLFLFIICSCTKAPEPVVTPVAPAAVHVPDEGELKQMLARFAPVELKVDISKLSKGDKNALKKIIQASKIMDEIFLDQYWGGNPGLKSKLGQDPSSLGQARLAYFNLNAGPWSGIDNGTAFIPDVPAKHPLVANFYPEDMTKEEFESWLTTIPKEQQERAKGFFTIIGRNQTTRQPTIVPFSIAYADNLKAAAELLKGAAKDTTNASLKKFLNLRATAFMNDDYYLSDLAWMDLDAPLEITIGPYETYNDEMFGYKASFESFVTIRDEVETNKLGFFSKRLQEVESHLPIDEQYRNPKLGALSPIRVVNQVISGGDANHGVRTAAFNLPNDERIVHEKGSKRVMLKNVQEAKFREILVPIAKQVLAADAQENVKFDSFFTHILAHELSHGLGPHKIKIQGRDSDPRSELKDLYSAIEEAKADITGLYLLQYLFDHGGGGGLKGGEKAEHELYTTYLASAFRTLRFGAHEAHGRGMTMQINYILDKGGFKVNPDGTFDVDFTKVKDAVRDLDHDLLTLEATGDYAGAQKLLSEKAKLTPDIQNALNKLTTIPSDIVPVPTTAEELLKSN